MDNQRRTNLLEMTHLGRLSLATAPALFFDENKVERASDGKFAPKGSAGGTKSADAADASKMVSRTESPVKGLYHGINDEKSAKQYAARLQEMTKVQKDFHDVWRQRAETNKQLRQAEYDVKSESDPQKRESMNKEIGQLRGKLDSLLKKELPLRGAAARDRVRFGEYLNDLRGNPGTAKKLATAFATMFPTIGKWLERQGDKRIERKEKGQYEIGTSVEHLDKIEKFYGDFMKTQDKFLAVNGKRIAAQSSLSSLQKQHDGEKDPAKKVKLGEALTTAKIEYDSLVERESELFGMANSQRGDWNHFIEYLRRPPSNEEFARMRNIENAIDAAGKVACITAVGCGIAAWTALAINNPPAAAAVAKNMSGTLIAVYLGYLLAKR